MRKALQLAAANPYVQMFIWFIFRDSTSTDPSRRLWFSGLEKANGQKKPAYAAFAVRGAAIVGQSQFVRPGAPVQRHLRRAVHRLPRPARDRCSGSSTRSRRADSTVVVAGSPRVTLARDETVTFQVKFSPVKGQPYTLTVDRQGQARPDREARDRPDDGDRRPGDLASRVSARVPRVGALDGITAIVTGASSGIGAATAAALAREGARVVGGARRVERLETEVALALDVTDPASCERFVEAAGPCDILVNAAGLALGRAPFDESSEEDERTVFETNVNGLVRMTRLVLTRSLREPGHIVNIGSIAGRWAYPNGASYVTSKFAVRGFTRALREDLLGRDIRVTTSMRASSRPSSRSCASAATPRRPRSVYEGTRPLSAEDVADCDPLRGHPPAAHGRRRAGRDVDRPVERRPDPPPRSG